MTRRFKTGAVIFLLCLTMLEPVLENLDPWDFFPDAGDNIILILLTVAACFAFVLCLAALAAGCRRRLAAIAPASAPRLDRARSARPESAPPLSLTPLRV